MRRYHAETRHSTPLLDWRWPSQDPPLAREGDPVTSHLAGEHVAATTREAHCAALLKAITSTPGHIASYYAGLLGIEGGWKRCSDLVTSGQAHYSGTQVGPSGRACGRLWPGPSDIKDSHYATLNEGEVE